jgi:hypothetical protein
MKTVTPDRGTSPSSGNLGRDESTGDLRRMAPIYVAVVVVEALVLSGLWWFQRTFS